MSTELATRRSSDLAKVVTKKSPEATSWLRRFLGGAGRVGRTAGSIGGKVLAPLAAASLPFDLEFLISNYGNDTSVSREYLGDEYQDALRENAVYRREEIGADAEEASNAFVTKHSADQFEGLRRLQQSVESTFGAAGMGFDLESLIQRDRGVISQIAQQTPPTLAEIYAAGGII